MGKVARPLTIITAITYIEFTFDLRRHKRNWRCQIKSFKSKCQKELQRLIILCQTSDMQDLWSLNKDIQGNRKSGSNKAKNWCTSNWQTELWTNFWGQRRFDSRVGVKHQYTFISWNSPGKNTWSWVQWKPIQSLGCPENVLPPLLLHCWNLMEKMTLGCSCLIPRS